MIKINIGRNYIYEFNIEGYLTVFGIILEKDKDYFHIKYYGEGNFIEYLTQISGDEYVKKERVKTFRKISSDYFDALKITMYDDAIKYIEENTPKPTRKEKEKRKGWLSIFKHDDKQGGLSVV